MREYRGGAFGEDRRLMLVYLIPTSDRDDIIAGLDREVRKMDPENEDLRQQLREVRRDRESGDTFARATSTVSSERVEAVRMGAKKVWADILGGTGLEERTSRLGTDRRQREAYRTWEGVPATATKILEDTDGGGIWSRYGLRL